jgi:hypothetical protein
VARCVTLTNPALAVPQFMVDLEIQGFKAPIGNGTM